MSIGNKKYIVDNVGVKLPSKNYIY